MSATTLSTHVLDLVSGMPAAGMPVRLEQQQLGHWTQIATGHTDTDGRWRAAQPVVAGIYRWVFQPGDESFFPEITVAFRVGQTTHVHVPLLLSAYGYSTYRGS